MMTLVFFFSFFVVLSFCSNHTLMVMMLIEFLVLYSFFTIFSYSSSWVLCLMFLFVSVCVGAYGVSVFLSIYRCKGSSYLLGFKTF